MKMNALTRVVVAAGLALTATLAVGVGAANAAPAPSVTSAFTVAANSATTTDPTSSIINLSALDGKASVTAIPMWIDARHTITSLTTSSLVGGWISPLFGPIKPSMSVSVNVTSFSPLGDVVQSDTFSNGYMMPSLSNTTLVTTFSQSVIRKTVVTLCATNLTAGLFGAHNNCVNGTAYNPYSY